MAEQRQGDGAVETNAFANGENRMKKIQKKGAAETAPFCVSIYISHQPPKQEKGAAGATPFPKSITLSAAEARAVDFHSERKAFLPRQKRRERPLLCARASWCKAKKRCGRSHTFSEIDHFISRRSVCR